MQKLLTTPSFPPKRNLQIVERRNSERHACVSNAANIAKLQKHRNIAFVNTHEIMLQ